MMNEKYDQIKFFFLLLIFIANNITIQSYTKEKNRIWTWNTMIQGKKILTTRAIHHLFFS